MLFLHRSRPRFQGWKHINLSVWQYTAAINSDGSLTTGSYPAFYTLSQLQGLAAMGFDSVRFVIPGDPMVLAAYNGQTALLASIIAQIIPCVRLCVSAGLSVNVDAFQFKPANDTPISTNVLASINPSSPWFVAYVHALTAVATALAANFLPEQAALELMNEPTPPSNYWANTLQPVAFAAARASAPQLTLIVKGEGDTTANLSNINVSQYDWNTLYSVHQYDYIDFTYCASTELGAPRSYYGAVDYPPDGLSPATAIATATANINGDATLTGTQKSAYIALATTDLTTYYAYFTRSALLVSNYGGLITWASANGVDNSQIYLGEHGATQVGNANTTSVSARAAWFSDTCGWFTARNIRWGIFSADIPSWAPVGWAGFYLQTPSAGAGSICSSANVPASIKTALGLT